MCAERAAVAAAVARGVREFTAIMIATEADTPTPPCGICRQVLMEFAPQLAVMSVTRAGADARWTMSELLPEAFTPTSLGRR
jgi:cytidine deaminase